MTVRLLFFAALVDQLGTASEELHVPVQALTVRDLVGLLRERGGAWDKTFSAGTVRVTVNKKFVDLSAPIQDGDEIAFISAQM
jgi:molybdopterin synthase sulfur carrier subunit